MSVVLVIIRYKSLYRPDLSSRGTVPSVVCITERDREASTQRRPLRTRGCCALEDVAH